MASGLIIAVDFDGTIVEHVYPQVGQPVPGAAGWLQTWQAYGARIILWTMRSGQELADAVEYMANNGILLWGINENPDQHTWTKSRKAYAQLYVDDAAFGCPLIPGLNGDRPMVDWSIIGPAVLAKLQGA